MPSRSPLSQLHSTNKETTLIATRRARRRPHDSRISLRPPLTHRHGSPSRRSRSSPSRVRRARTAALSLAALAHDAQAALSWLSHEPLLASHGARTAALSRLSQSDPLAALALAAAFCPLSRRSHGALSRLSRLRPLAALSMAFSASRGSLHVLLSRGSFALRPSARLSPAAARPSRLSPALLARDGHGSRVLTLAYSRTARPVLLASR
ncbi:hypothetical protein Syun_023696 [Stephania yunnanensis]|uniref:Uncharacterized protein n=1 Tax=Stephania yunnanensis TaxID=152371 RepID=A0AAP0I3L4_9MAGN